MKDGRADADCRGDWAFLGRCRGAAFATVMVLAACPSRAGEDGTLPRAAAVFTARPPVVDGRWHPAEWEAADRIFFPSTESSEPSACEVRLLWNEHGLYLGAVIPEATPVFGSIPAGQSLHEEDVFEVFIDPAGDHRQYFEIQWSPDNQRFLKRYVLSEPPRSTARRRLTAEFLASALASAALPATAGLRSAASLDAAKRRWVLEAFLPAEFLNGPSGGRTLEPGSWRVNFARFDWDAPLERAGRQGRFVTWAAVEAGCAHISPEAMGILVLVRRSGS